MQNHLLHLRASLERKWNQPRRHPMYIGPSLNSRVRNQEGTTSWPSIWKTTAQREHYVAHNLRKRCVKRHFQGILNFVHLNSNMIEMKRSVSRWMKLAQTDFKHRITQGEQFQYRRNWRISLNNDRTSGRLKNRSDFNEVLSTLHHPHQESGERQLWPVPFWKYQYWHQS